jgi:hypothetical protein
MSAALADARKMLATAGYGDELVDADYPVWLDAERGVDRAQFVAFGRLAPRDMSTAVITVTQGSAERAFDIARAFAAPFFLVVHRHAVDLWVAESSRPAMWRESATDTDVAELRRFLTPAV